MKFLSFQLPLRAVLLLVLLLLAAAPPTVARAAEGDRESRVRGDRQRVEAAGFWIYNDLDAAFVQAKETGKPILMVLRCLPCDECVKLDDELIDNHPVILPLLKQFVRVRVVGTNGLDLSLFQYDTDQSFAAFMLNADKTIYGRFGTRSHRTEWVGDVSIDGMARALRGALELHKHYPANAASLAGKRGQPLEFASPEKYPTLSDRPARLDYEGDVVKSCVHCHQIGEARRDYYWQRGEAIPAEIMHPYPHPKSIGLVLDARYPARVKAIIADSPAEAAKLEPGDDIVSISGQPLLSMADVQWVLNSVPSAGGEVDLIVHRGDWTIKTKLSLDAGWRKLDDTSWRTQSWTMRRIALGGMRLTKADADTKAKLRIGSPMALTVSSLGRYGLHATARKSGFRENDVLIRFDGIDDFQRESDVFDHVNTQTKVGDRVEIEFLRDGKKMTKTLPIQR